MLRLVFHRFLAMLPTMALVSMLIFGLQQLLPGDPAKMLAGEDQDPAVIAYLHAKMHLDAPLPARYGYWIGAVMHGDLGESVRNQQPVRQLIAQKLPVTIELACLAMLIAVAIGVPLGVVSAVAPGSAAARLSQAFGLWGISVPNFWLGILLILFFSVRLGWLPASGYVPFTEDPMGNLKAMVMPAFVLGNAIAAVLMRHTRSAMLAVLSSDYVRTARAKGVNPFRVVVRHALINALTPVITLSALELGTLISGSVLTEQVFTIPGFGKLMIDAVFNRDYGVVQGVVLVTAFAYLVLNLLSDVLALQINPRLKAGT